MSKPKKAVIPHLQEGDENLVDPSEIFKFVELPNELKYKILGYIPERDAKTFCTLLRVSKSMKHFCEAAPFKFERCIPEIICHATLTQARIMGSYVVNMSDINRPYIRITADVLSHQDLLDDIRAYGVIKMCYVQKIRAAHLRTQDVVCRTEVFQGLINVIEAVEWVSDVFVKKNLLKGLRVTMVLLVDTDIDDETLLQTHFRHLHLADTYNRAVVSDEGLNAYIKEWLHGKRDMGTIEIAWDLSRRNILALVDGLTLNPIWTEVHHQYSLLSRYSLNQIYERTSGLGMEQIFTIFPSRNYKQYRILRIAQTCFRIDCPPQTEVNVLRRIEADTLKNSDIFS